LARGFKPNLKRRTESDILPGQKESVTTEASRTVMGRQMHKTEVHLSAVEQKVETHKHVRNDILDFFSTPFWNNIPDKPASFPPSAHTHTKADITDFAHTHPRGDITDFFASPFWGNIPDKPPTFPPSTHATTHQSGGSDALTGNLDANARVGVMNAGTLVGTRRRVNFIAGTNVSLNAVDDATNEKVDVTINASLQPHNLLSDAHADTQPTLVQRGMLIVGQLIGTVIKWAGLALGAAGKFLKSTGTDVVWDNVTAGDVAAGQFGANTGGGNYSFPGNVGIGTTTPGQRLEVSGNIKISGSGTTITTSNTELVLEQTGDQYGTTRLRLQNRTRANGVVFEQAGTVDLVDCVFKSLSDTGNIRFESRSGFPYTMRAPQFEIGSPGNPTLIISDIGIAVFRGNAGIGTLSPTSKLHIVGSTGYNQLRLQTPYTPTSSNDPNGNVGDICWDNNYIYVKTSTGWRRAPLSAF
jgi:hypothetical protein